MTSTLAIPSTAWSTTPVSPCMRESGFVIITSSPFLNGSSGSSSSTSKSDPLRSFMRRIGRRFLFRTLTCSYLSQSIRYSSHSLWTFFRNLPWISCRAWKRHSKCPLLVFSNDSEVLSSYATHPLSALHSHTYPRVLGVCGADCFSFSFSPASSPRFLPFFFVAWSRRASCANFKQEATRSSGGTGAVSAIYSSRRLAYVVWISISMLPLSQDANGKSPSLPRNGSAIEVDTSRRPMFTTKHMAYTGSVM
mmetsp:Transcript_9992/g.23499  ORF Transcript_9992/g.23499 Transcript_9992/m.23499 type:complete len:250 (+) Transcript_9992:409-1158(+)